MFNNELKWTSYGKGELYAINYEGTEGRSNFNSVSICAMGRGTSITFFINISVFYV